MRLNAGTVEPRALADDEYDAEGWPLATISLSRRNYSLALGPCSCWLAEFDKLPGYYGEGETIQQALQRLRQSLGPRPHFRVTHDFRRPAKLETDIKRSHRAMAAAAKTRATALGR